MGWEEAKTEGRTDLNVNNIEIITNIAMCAPEWNAGTLPLHFGQYTWHWAAGLVCGWVFFQGYDLNFNHSLNGEVHGSDIYPKPFALHPINAHCLHSCPPLFRSQTCGMVCSLFSLQHNFVPSEIKMYKIWGHNNKMCFNDKKNKSRGKRRGEIGNSY